MMKDSQVNRLIYHMLKGNSITPVSALVNFGVGRLAARIFEIKQLGFDVQKTMKNVNGNRYAEYSMVMPPYDAPVV